jgi:hypothetical protein
MTAQAAAAAGAAGTAAGAAAAFDTRAAVPAGQHGLRAVRVASACYQRGCQRGHERGWCGYQRGYQRDCQRGWCDRDADGPCLNDEA